MKHRKWHSAKYTSNSNKNHLNSCSIFIAQCQLECVNDYTQCRCSTKLLPNSFFTHTLLICKLYNLLLVFFLGLFKRTHQNYQLPLIRFSCGFPSSCSSLNLNSISNKKPPKFVRFFHLFQQVKSEKLFIFSA